MRREWAAQSSARDGCLYDGSKPKTSVAGISQTCRKEIWGLVGVLTPSWRSFYSCWSSRDVVRVRETHVDWSRD